MHVLADELGMLAPGVCTVCEMSPDRKSQKVVDTLREHRVGELVTPLTGRKYICQPCVVQAFNALLAVDVPAED